LASRSRRKSSKSIYLIFLKEYSVFNVDKMTQMVSKSAQVPKQPNVTPLIFSKGWGIRYNWSINGRNGDQIGSFIGVDNGVEVRYQTKNDLMHVEMILNSSYKFDSIQARFNGDSLFKSGVGFCVLEFARKNSLKIITDKRDMALDLEGEKRYEHDFNMVDFKMVDVIFREKAPEGIYLRT
jgi:hypothetical protein